MDKYTVIQDTREKERPGKWHFSVSDYCNGTIEQTMKTGDYTLLGFENDFILERKGKLSEFATNINEARFTRELERLEEFKYPFLLLEFSMGDVMQWPLNSGIPKDKIHLIRTTKHFILLKMNEILVKYKTKIILAGKDGQMVAASLFKRIVENG